MEQLGPKCLHILIRVPFDDCSGVVHWMKSVSSRILCGQHDADEEIKTTHCHIALEPTVSNEAIRKQLIKHSLGGQKYSIMERVLKTHELIQYKPLCVYIVKGDPTHVKLTTETHDDILRIASEWKNRVKKLDVDLTNSNEESGHTGITGSNVTLNTDNKSEWDKLLSKFQKRPNNTDMTMAQIKKWIKSVYLEKHKPIPRDGDTNRYAYSLWAIINDKTSYECISHCDSQANISQL